MEPSRLGSILGLVAKAGSSSPAWVEFVRAIAWPVVALAAIAAVIFSGTLRGWLVELVRRVRKVSGWGVDVELSERVSNEVRELSEEAFGAFRRRVITEFDRLVHTYRIDVKRKRLVDEYIRPRLEQRGRRSLGDIRCTVHIEDVLFTETLYQLLDYYPPSPGPRGRTFSIRFGIVGKAWRSRSDQVESHVPVDRDQLIRDWGMTWDEVAWAGHGRQSFACIMLRDGSGEPVCIVYFDSLGEDAFGANEEENGQLAQVIRQGANQIGLTNDIAKICQDLRERSPFISLHTIGTKT